MEYDPAWWELAFTTDDRLAGLVMPTQLPSAATIGYIGVAPEMRGKGYGEVLLVRGMATLLKSMRLTNPTYHFAAEFAEVGG
jgi:GNAT superfamily N-acetyltransferase